ncbi:MAG: lytic murein transglycosylase [Deltaproteobacteria bacterium]|nr:lytic murein transglycosylase [Deltaproteobacteria bacterium]
MVMLGAGPSLGRVAKPLAADLVQDGQVIDLSSPRYTALFKELSGDGFSREELSRLFAGVKIRKRVLELMDKQYEALPYYKYYPIFINAQVVAQGRKLLRRYKAVLDRVENKFGVERQIVVAIWGMESRYGRHQGVFNMFRTLNTMFDAYPRRRTFYRRQLISYLLLCRKNKVNPLTSNGSYGAAFGQTQFIPTSFREYAVDFDGDGRRDVWNSVPDVLASIANYLHSFHWVFKAPVYVELGHELKAEPLRAAYKRGRKGLLSWRRIRDLQQIALPEPHDDRPLTVVGLELPHNKMRYVAGYPNFQAITKWNNSNRYAMAVTELAARLRGAGDGN